MTIEEVKVGPHTYKIIEMYDNWHGETESFGQCDTKEQTIKLSTNMTKTRKQETLLHEILHAIYYEYSIGDCKEEEHMVGMLGQALTQVLIDNPKLKRQF